MTDRTGAHDGAARVSLVDTHCHLDADPFAGEPTSAILARAAREGVDRVVTIGVDVASSRRAVAIAGAHDGVYATVGVDPNDLGPDGLASGDLEAIDALAGDPSVVAVGEIGLDYYWDRVPRDVQRDAFVAQLDLAARRDLPVVIHCREALDDVRDILLDWAAVNDTAAGRPRGVMHCYSGDLPLAERLIAAGFLISFAGNVTYRNATPLASVAAALPDSAIVIETDAPYLSPHPHRGKRNEPARVRVTAEHVAALRGVEVAALGRTTSANAGRLFGWNGAPA